MQTQSLSHNSFARQLPILFDGSHMLPDDSPTLKPPHRGRRYTMKHIYSNRGIRALVAGCLALLVSGPAAAHHSFAAAYNMEDPISIVGKVVDVRLTNPHSHFFLDVAA